MRSLLRPLARQITVGRTKDACRSCSRRQVIALLHFGRPTSLDMFTANFTPDSLLLLDDPFEHALVIVNSPVAASAADAAASVRIEA